MPEHGEPLSTREEEILSLVATGVTNREVAHRLGISPNTVKVHMRNIFAKLGAESRTEATMVAVQRGLVHVDGGTMATEAEEGIESPSRDEDTTLHSAPLPWFKRLALVAALLLAAAGPAPRAAGRRHRKDRRTLLARARPDAHPPGLSGPCHS